MLARLFHYGSMGCGASKAYTIPASGPPSKQAPSASKPQHPPLIKKESNAENQKAYEAGTLKHEPPQFEFFDPAGREDAAVMIKEVKLPLALQTHEVCYEPVTKCVFVSQMSNSVLVRIPIDENGFLASDQDAWRVGELNDAGDGISGMHNVSLSAAHPGCLWISLQYANQLLLVDVRAGSTLRVLQVLHVPTCYTDPETGTLVHVGGPHCMREEPTTGDVWVGLKGALKDAPCGKASKSARSSCCNPEALEANMALLARRGMDTPIPEGWAVWRVAPSRYDPKAADGAKGGVIYPCLKSPPMLDFDGHGNAYVPQDGVDTLLHIDAESGACEQLTVPFPAGEPPRGGAAPRITGPAIARGPDGAIWMSLLGSYNALVRIDADDGKGRTLYNFGGPPWASKLRLIHIAFSAADKDDGQNRIYALSSDLLDDEAVNSIVVLLMDQKWRKCLGRRVIPLPTQDCACHRIAFVDAAISGQPGRSRSIVVTELASSKLLQIKTQHLTDVTSLTETISTDSDGFEVRTYVDTGDAAASAC